jgi:hypothetical protein
VVPADARLPGLQRLALETASPLRERPRRDRTDLLELRRGLVGEDARLQRLLQAGDPATATGSGYSLTQRGLPRTAQAASRRASSGVGLRVGGR